MSLGFEQAGFDVVAAVEYDPVHAATHAFNFPKCEILCRDISKISATDVLAAARQGFKLHHPNRAWPGRIDAIIGGPPCQGFSSGGKRDSGDERNSLLLEFVRLVEELMPRVLCLENVAGLLESKFDAVRTTAFARLRAAGYALSGEDATVNSLHFRVPQSRRRVIVLGALGEIAPARPEIVAGQVTVAEALQGLPSPADYPELLSADRVDLRPEHRLMRLMSSDTYARGLNGLLTIDGDKSRPRRWNSNVLTGSRRTVHSKETIGRFSLTGQGSVEPKSRLYRLPLDGPSRTLRAGTGSERGSHTSPRPIHPTEDRVITVREAARLHGYPDWFGFHITNWHGHRQIGNSVPPPLARAAGKALLKSLSNAPIALRNSISLGDVSLLGLSRTQAKEVVRAVSSEMPPTRTRVAAEISGVSEVVGHPVAS